MSPPGETAGSARRAIQKRAIRANCGIVLLGVATGGLSADLFQLWASDVLHFSPAQVGIVLGFLVLSILPQPRAVRWVNEHGRLRDLRA